MSAEKPEDAKKEEREKAMAKGYIKSWLDNDLLRLIKDIKMG